MADTEHHGGQDYGEDWGDYDDDYDHEREDWYDDYGDQWEGEEEEEYPVEEREPDPWHSGTPSPWDNHHPQQQSQSSSSRQWGPSGKGRGGKPVVGVVTHEHDQRGQFGGTKRIIHDIPPTWDGKDPKTQLETYLKL